MRYFPVGKDDPIKSVVSNIEIKKIKFEPRFIYFPFFQKILMIFFVFYSTLLKMNVKRFIKKFQDYFFKLLCIEKKQKKTILVIVDNDYLLYGGTNMRCHQVGNSQSMSYSC